MKTIFTSFLFVVIALVLGTNQAFAQEPYLEDFTSTTGSDLGLKSLPEGWDVIGSMGAYERRTDIYHNGKPGIAINGNTENYLVTPALEAGTLAFYLRQYTKNYAASVKCFYCSEVNGVLTVGDQIGDEAYMPKATPSWSQHSVELSNPSRVAIIVYSGILDDFLAVNGLYTPEPTAVVDVKTAQEDGVAYNIYGQRVDENAKGLIIKNGKKYFNK